MTYTHVLTIEETAYYKLDKHIYKSEFTPEEAHCIISFEEEIALASEAEKQSVLAYTEANKHIAPLHLVEVNNTTLQHPSFIFAYEQGHDDPVYIQIDGTIIKEIRKNRETIIDQIDHALAFYDLANIGLSTLDPILLVYDNGYLIDMG